MGYDHLGNRKKSQQKTVKPPQDLTVKQTEKWLNEQAVLFERAVKREPQAVDRTMTLAKYIAHWRQDVAPNKLAKSTIVRMNSHLLRILPELGQYKLQELTRDHFRHLYATLRTIPNSKTGKPLSEITIEGSHSILCGILSDAVEEGYLTQNPAWRSYKPQGTPKEKAIANQDVIGQLLTALEGESLKYQVFFKLIVATGMRRGECTALRWEDVHLADGSIHIQRTAVKVGGEDVFEKAPKTRSGNRYVYVSGELLELLKAYKASDETGAVYLFQQTDKVLPMLPDTFSTKLTRLVKKYYLPKSLTIHGLRHSVASLLIANGTDVTTVSSLLGHAQVSTTLDIYSHAFDGNRRTASRKLHAGLGL